MLTTLITTITTLLAVQLSQPILWDIDALNRKDSHVVATDAGRILRKAPVVVTDKPARIVSDTHYYVSIGIYWWPDPENPDAPYIRRDGDINPEVQDYDSPKFSKLVQNLTTLSQAFYLTGDKRYYDGWLTQLKAWFLDSETKMYPNLEYGQIHPGHNGNIGNAAGIIEMYHLQDVLESIRLVNMYADIPEDVLDGMQKWTSDFADWLMTSKIGIAESRTKNNHAIAYDALLYNLCEFAGRSDISRKISDEFVTNRLEKQIMADGSQPEELARTRAWHYVVYNLQHVVDFCVMQDRAGNNMYKDNKALIDSAFDWARPYIGHPEIFPYQEKMSTWDDEEKSLKAEMKRVEKLVQ